MKRIYNSAFIVSAIFILITSCQREQQPANTDYIDIDIGGVGFFIATNPTYSTAAQSNGSDVSDTERLSG